jgi:tetratricopeptide (TPR) repeat protein
VGDPVKSPVVALLAGFGLLLSAKTLAGQMPANSGLQTNTQYAGGMRAGSENLFMYAAVEVEVEGPDEAPVDGPIAVSLIRENGQVLMTAMAVKGKAKFDNVPKSVLTAQVVAPGFQTAKKGFDVSDRSEVKVKIGLQPMSDKEAAAADKGIAALSPKAQKDVGKALEALRVNKPADARNHLEAAQKEAPSSAEVEYLFGVYASQLNNPAQAQAYWMKALELDPRHLSTLLAVSQGLLQQRKAAEAMPYLARALDAEPLSWRAHGMMAQADLSQGHHDDAVKEAERAMELGHEPAASLAPVLAHALYESGEKERAIRTLQEYAAAHPTDQNASILLESMTKPAAAAAGSATEVTTSASSLPLPSNWLPPDVDENIPPVEAGAACSVDDVVEKAGKRIEEFVHDVDRFTATETMTHVSINKYGIASAPEKRKFDYLVSIQELRPGDLGVTEYRGSGTQAQFPDGIVTNGLPSLILIFHPFYAPDYEMTCEGLARANGRLAWQVHFRQRPDKPSEIKSYQIGMDGPSYAVSLKGRAWISADSYQIIRMETDIVGPMPQIRLLAEHTEIEYGPVSFHKDNVNLWLPQSVDVYFAWLGRQIHRRHSFNNYKLFAVEEKQQISAPKEAEPTPDAGTSSPAKPTT